MSLGTGIVLLVIGAVLAFALNFHVAGLDIHLIGYILMIAGAVGVILGIVLITRRRQTVSTVQSSVDPVGNERVVRRTTEDDAPLV